MDCMRELNWMEAKPAELVKGKEAELPGTALFRMADYIRVGTKIGQYRVTYVGKSFMKHFGHVEERDIPSCALSTSVLQSWAMDPEVIRGMGGPDAIPESYMYHLIETIRLGEAGPGMFNGYTNLFYKTSDVDGKLWSPHFYLRGDRLGFGALPACYDDGWEPGDLIYTWAKA